MFMIDVVKRGSVIELTDNNRKTLYGRVVDFRMQRDNNKYNTFIFIEEIEDGNTSSEHYGQAAIAVDDIKDITLHENLANNLPLISTLK